MGNEFTKEQALLTARDFVNEVVGWRYGESARNRTAELEGNLLLEWIERQPDDTTDVLPTGQV